MILSDTIIARTIAYAKERLSGSEGGHDWYHTERVWKMAKFIRDKEGEGDRQIIELAALLHDIDDPKFNGGDDEVGSQQAFDFLTNNNLDRRQAEHIRTIIKYLSFKGGFPQDRINTIEFQIVQDADRLDAMGAIGIARAFNYGGFRNRPIHDPSKPFQEYADSKAYHASDAPTINHFYEKLLKLKDLMNTPTGTRIAEERHAFMLQFLDRFYDECEPGRSGTRTNNSD